MSTNGCVISPACVYREGWGYGVDRCNYTKRYIREAEDLLLKWQEVERSRKDSEQYQAAKEAKETRLRIQSRLDKARAIAEKRSFAVLPDNASELSLLCMSPVDKGGGSVIDLLKGAQTPSIDDPGISFHPQDFPFVPIIDASSALSSFSEELAASIVAITSNSECIYYRSAGYSAQECKDAGFSIRECKDAGFSFRDLRSAGFSIRECKDTGFSFRDLRLAGFSIRECKDAGFSTRECKDAGFSIQECKDAGFSFRDLRSAGFSLRECKDAGFSTRECKDAGFSIWECKDAGFSEQECLDAGFSFQECNYYYNYAVVGLELV